MEGVTHQADYQNNIDNMGCHKSKPYVVTDSIQKAQGSTIDEQQHHVLQKLRSSEAIYDDDDSDDESPSNYDKMYMYDNAHETYEYFWKGDDIYSQWHRSVFYEDGIKFNCAEQYMMHGKAKLFDDEDTAKRILKADSPRKIKQLGREVRGFVEEIWKYRCLDIVKQGNMLKFSQNDKLRKEMFATYPKILVEASPYDKIWGIGLEEHQPEALKKSKWQGTNYLGYIVTEVRNDLMIEKGKLNEEFRMNFVKEEQEKFRPAYDFIMSTVVDAQDKTPPVDDKNITTKKNNNSRKGTDKFPSTSNVDLNKSMPPAMKTSSNDSNKVKDPESLPSMESAFDEWTPVPRKSRRKDSNSNSMSSNHGDQQPVNNSKKSKKKKKKGKNSEQNASDCISSEETQNCYTSHGAASKADDDDDFEPHIPQSNTGYNSKHRESKGQDSVSRDSVSRDSVSRDSVSRDSVSRDSTSLSSAQHSDNDVNKSEKLSRRQRKNLKKKAKALEL